MGVFSALFGCRGVVGFNGCCSGASSGVRGFKFLVIAACRGGTGFICPLPELWDGLLMAPRVFQAPEAPAAREARRPHFVQRRASKPARALRSLRRPPHQWGLVCWRVPVCGGP